MINVVMNNNAYGNTRDRQRLAHEGRYLGVSYGNADLAGFATSLGGFGVRVRATTTCALARRGPSIVDVVQDPLYGLPPGLTPPTTR